MTDFIRMISKKIICEVFTHFVKTEIEKKVPLIVHIMVTLGTESLVHVLAGRKKKNKRQLRQNTVHVSIMRNPDFQRQVLTFDSLQSSDSS